MSNFKLRKYIINAIKTRIICRKYAYIFYRKSVSQILPSTARKFYNNKLKKEYFEKLKIFVFAERTAWRLELRSKVHYNYKTKLKSLRQWQVFFIRKKEKKIKLEIANIRFAKQAKKKYFVRLAYYPILKKFLHVFEIILQKHVVYLFLNFNILQLKQTYLKLHKEYLIKLYAKEKQNNRYCKRSLGILRRFVCYRSKKRENYTKAINFIRRKSFPDFVGEYFKKWLYFTSFQVFQRESLEKAQYFYNFKTLRMCFKKLVWHKDEKQIERFNSSLSEKVYVRKLLLKSLKQLKTNVTYQKQLKTAEVHYKVGLKKKCFVSLHFYCRNKQRLNELFVYLRNKLEVNQKRALFNKLLVYKNVRKEKRERNLKATIYYEEKLKQKCFKKLAKYTNFCLIKEQHFTVISKINQRILRRYFVKWKLYEAIILEKQLKNILVQKYLQKMLLRKYFNDWKCFSVRLKYERLKSQLLIKKDKFEQWQKFVDGKKMYKKQIQEAQQMYKSYLLRAGLGVIIRAGIEKQNYFERLAFKNHERKFNLLIKYYKIWKQKVLSEEIRPSTQKDIDKFAWNPLCFQKPKIPAYFQQKTT